LGSGRRHGREAHETDRSERNVHREAAGVSGSPGFPNTRGAAFRAAPCRFWRAGLRTRRCRSGLAALHSRHAQARLSASSEPWCFLATMCSM
jgi:hypothetical protein